MLLLLALGCDSPTPYIQGTGICIWNQAYQERSRAKADSIEEILAGAQGCYVLVDPFDTDTQDQVQAAIPEISQDNELSCYVSVGTCEEWRADFGELAPFCTDTEWDDWPGEFFVSDTAGALPHMEARLERAAEVGCEWVEFDNMDWAQDDASRQSTGFAATEAQGMEYMEALCERTHELGMKCMAKSSTLGSERFDGGTFESFPQDMDWWDHQELQTLLDAGKPGIVVHYDERDCESAAGEYRTLYDPSLSFLCEDRSIDAYRRL